MSSYSESERKIYEQAFSDAIPQNKALGIEVVEVARGRGTLRLPWKEELVGNPETGVIHGGAITTMLDACCGMAIATLMKKPQPFATLDLRIDYVRPATKGEAVIAEAECYRITSNVAFTRAVAHHGNPAEPIAAASGTFMLATKGRSRNEPLIRDDGRGDDGQGDDGRGDGA